MSTLEQPAGLQPGATPPGWVPFETPAPPAIKARKVHHSLAQRHAGTEPAPRHAGVTHTPHRASLAAHHALPHRARQEAARHRQPAGRHHVVGHPSDRLHVSHARLRARVAAAQRFELGVITAYNGGANTASVRLYGSQANVVGPIPVGLGLAGLPATPVGLSCMVAMFDDANPADALVVALYNGTLGGGYVQSGRVGVALSSYQATATINLPNPYPNAALAAVATSEDPGYVATVGPPGTGGFVITVTRREGAQQIQQGTVNVTIPGGQTQGTAAVSFPAAYAVGRSVVASSQDARFWAGANGIGAGGFTATLTSPTAVVGNQTATVDWVAAGDPAVSITVQVDWVATGR